jgi:starvation-inducible DNA-binding protein
MKPTAKTYKSSVDLDTTLKGEMIGLLNQQLADSFDLYSQTKQAHWNVKGMNFFHLHGLFDEIADAIEDHVDDLAERVTALGADAQGTARMAAQNTTLPEFPDDLSTGEDFVRALIERLGAYANSNRRAASAAMEGGDEITADLFVEITRESDKLLYFLEAHLR